MSYNQLKNASEETEILGTEDEKLRQMLGELKKVAAPANFDFRLKARIANYEQSTASRPFLFPALRFVMPLSLVVLLAGFVVFNVSLPTGQQSDTAVLSLPQTQNEADVASNRLAAQPQINDSIIAANASANDSGASKPAPEIVRSVTRPIANNANIILVKDSFGSVAGRGEKNSKSSSGGSQDKAVKELEVITASNSNRNSEAIKQVIVPQNKISLQSVLSEIGIEADYDEKNWKILSVRENSQAKRAGLQAGDLIEAIDDKKPSSDEVYLQKFSGKVFRVLRDGKPVVIDLTSKQ